MKAKLAKISAVVITITLGAILLSQIEIADIIVTLASIDPLYLIAGFLLYTGSYFFRAMRFHILLIRKVRLRDLFNIVCVHNMMNNILPARTGELSYIYLLKKLHNKKTGEGIATLFVARVFDFITISLLFLVSVFMMHDLPEMVIKTVWAIALFLSSITIFLIALLYFGNTFLNLVKRFFERFNWDKKYFADFLLRKGEETVDSFEKISANGKNTIIDLILTSLGIWLFLYSLNYIFVRGMDINLSYFEVIFASSFAVFTTILPIQGIGGFGTLETGWAVGFIAVGVTKEVAISSGFGYHIILWIYFLILGCWGLLRIGKG
jgi:uncharacterized protein (TIRG00374 family)